MVFNKRRALARRAPTFTLGKHGAHVITPPRGARFLISERGYIYHGRAVVVWFLDFVANQSALFSFNGLMAMASSIGILRLIAAWRSMPKGGPLRSPKVAKGP